MSAAIILGVAMVTVVYVAAIMVCFLYIRRCACMWLRISDTRPQNCNIFALWFLLLLSIFFLSFFLAYSQPLQIRCLPYFHTWCDLSANLGCRSETCCTRLTENAGRKKSSKIRYLRTTAQLCRAISSQLRHVSTIGKKLVKHQYVLHMSS